MEENLDNIAQSELDESNTQTDVQSENTEQNVVENEVNEQEAPVQDNAQPSKRESRYGTLKKSYDELRSFTDRKNNEYVQKIKQLESKLNTYQPLEQYLPTLQQALAEKRQQELYQQYQQNPLAVQQQLMEQMLNERLAPLQQQQVEAQNQQITNQTIDYMKQAYGEEAFKDASPYMANILNNTREQYGDQVADILARNPEHLFTTAFGYMALEKIREFTSQRQQGTQQKAQLAQQSAGVSRPNRTSRTVQPTSQQDIEKAAFDFLRQNA